ncbi:MAG: hypothetical protein A2Z47_07805 [Thermodesulfovibrio sp. RBG_19FT_COMBO_42_12]|nr:MAG: hypothetical protein A2Z47_07805 [Thermodesulfovibrio sp. RBG_19FT_COMBO_42_12]
MKTCRESGSLNRSQRSCPHSGGFAEENKRAFAAHMPAVTNTVISMKTLIIKSLLSSLYQREETYPSLVKSMRPFTETRSGRGEWRFFNNDALLMHFLVIAFFGFNNFLNSVCIIWFNEISICL